MEPIILWLSFVVGSFYIHLPVGTPCLCLPKYVPLPNRTQVHVHNRPTCTPLPTVPVKPAPSPYVPINWIKMSDGFSHVSVGQAGIWAIKPPNKIYYRVGSYNKYGTKGTSWNLACGGLVQLDVGTNIVWGVNPKNWIYLRIGITKSRPEGSRWVRIGGSLKQVSVSRRGHVWGITKDNRVYRRLGVTPKNPKGDRWTEKSGRLKQVSVGGMGVWGVNTRNAIYYRLGTLGDPDTAGTSWRRVSGSLMYVSSDKDNIWGVNSKGVVYRRLRVTRANPTGTSWQIIRGKRPNLTH